MRILPAALLAAAFTFIAAPGVFAQSDPITEDDETPPDPEPPELCPVVRAGGPPGGNGDVVVTNSSSSQVRPAVICPANANDASDSTATLPTSFQGSVSSLEDGDVVDTSSNSNFSASGTGGTINLDAGSTVVVSVSGAGSISVTWPDQNGMEQTTTVTAANSPKPVTAGDPPPT